MSTKKRIDWIDIAKGIAIILMILGHVPGLNHYVKGVIFSFHMPLFMMINGYLIRSYDIKKTFLRSCRTLLLPYMIVCVLLLLISMIKSGSADGALHELLRKGADMILGFSKPPAFLSSFGGVIVIWFLPCLFFARNIYVAAMSLLSRTPVWLRVAAVILLSAGGQLLGTFGIYLPWSLDVALFSVIFIAAGDLLHKKDLIQSGNRVMIILPPIVWIAMLLTKTHIELATRNYPLIVVGTICAIAGSVTFMQLSRLVEAKMPPLTKLFTWYGRNSLIILSVHALESKMIDWTSFAIPGLNSILNVAVAFVIRFAIISLCTLAFERIMFLIKKKQSNSGKEPEHKST